MHNKKYLISIATVLLLLQVGCLPKKDTTEIFSTAEKENMSAFIEDYIQKLSTLNTDTKFLAALEQPQNMLNIALATPETAFGLNSDNSNSDYTNSFKQSVQEIQTNLHNLWTQSKKDACEFLRKTITEYKLPPDVYRVHLYSGVAGEAYFANFKGLRGITFAWDLYNSQIAAFDFSGTGFTVSQNINLVEGKLSAFVGLAHGRRKTSDNVIDSWGGKFYSAKSDIFPIPLTGALAGFFRVNANFGISYFVSENSSGVQDKYITTKELKLSSIKSESLKGGAIVGSLSASLGLPIYNTSDSEGKWRFLIKKLSGEQANESHKYNAEITNFLYGYLQKTSDKVELKACGSNANKCIYTNKNATSENSIDGLKSYLIVNKTPSKTMKVLIPELFIMDLFKSTKNSVEKCAKNL